MAGFLAFLQNYTGRVRSSRDGFPDVKTGKTQEIAVFQANQRLFFDRQKSWHSSCNTH